MAWVAFCSLGAGSCLGLRVSERAGESYVDLKGFGSEQKMWVLGSADVGIF